MGDLEDMNLGFVKGFDSTDLNEEGTVRMNLGFVKGLELGFRKEQLGGIGNPLEFELREE